MQHVSYAAPMQADFHSEFGSTPYCMQNLCHVNIARLCMRSIWFKDTYSVRL